MEGFAFAQEFGAEDDVWLIEFGGVAHRHGAFDLKLLALDERGLEADFIQTCSCAAKVTPSSTVS